MELGKLMQFAKQFLPWKNNNYYMFLCMCVRACIDAERVDVCMCMRACSLAYLAYNAHAPYCIVICGLSGSTAYFDIIS
jgi:hypothetical protein